MKLKDIFNNIYSIEKISNYKKVSFGEKDKASVVKEVSKESSIKNQQKENVNFDDVVFRIRNDMNYKINESEQVAIFDFFNDLKREAKETLVTVKSYKEKLINDVKSSKTQHTLDLKKKPELLKYAKEIFQEEKDSISLDDYFTLLELKKQLEVDEFLTYSEED